MNARRDEADYYAILQVHERAIPEVIEKAYRVLVRKYHPDVHPADRRNWAHARMTQLNIAYEVLSDPERRSEYDAERRLGGGRSTDDEHVAAGAGTLKCFNHPKRPSVKFCWHCGRPICAACFGGERDGHTICVPCQLVLERDRRWRAGMDVADSEVEQARASGPTMGLTGLLTHYGALTLLLGAILWAVYDIALGFGNTEAQALTLVGGLAVVFIVLVVQRLTWRVVCPDCRATLGHSSFRMAAPWAEFLAPQSICPRCGHRFTALELHRDLE